MEQLSRSFRWDTFPSTDGWELLVQYLNYATYVFRVYRTGNGYEVRKGRVRDNVARELPWCKVEDMKMIVEGLFCLGEL